MNVGETIAICEKYHKKKKKEAIQNINKLIKKEAKKGFLSVCIRIEGDRDTLRSFNRYVGVLTRYYEYKGFTVYNHTISWRSRR